MYNTISVSRMNAILCLGVCRKRQRSALPPQTRQKWQKRLKSGILTSVKGRMNLSSKIHFIMHVGVKSTAQLLNRSGKTNMTRGWPQGRSPGVDIWPGGAGGEHVAKTPKRDQINESFFFTVVKIFIELVTSKVGVRLKRGKKLLGPWGWKIQPQIAKK